MSSVAICSASDHEEWRPAVRAVPWERFREELLLLYAPPLRSKATFAKIRQILDLVGGLGVASTSDLTMSLVAKFIAARPATESQNTTFTLVRALRTICNYAAANGYVARSPFAIRKTWVRRGQPKAKQHHSREAIARVLAKMKSEIQRKRGWSQWRARRLYALASTVAYTGLRKNEALYLRVEDIDLEARMIFVRSRRGNRLKTEKSAQPVPIPDALMPVLADWLPHLILPEEPAKAPAGPMPEHNPEGIRDAGWVFPNSYRTGPWVGGTHGYRPLDRMKIVGERAGVKGFTFLSLRHSWATHAEFWGLSDAMIQRMLRHTSPATQWYYRHADPANMQAKIGGVRFGHELTGVEADANGFILPKPEAPAAASMIPGKPVQTGPKLDDNDAEDIRRLRDAGWSYRRLALDFGVSISTIHYTLYGVIHRPKPPAGDLPCE